MAASEAAFVDDPEGRWNGETKILDGSATDSATS